MATTIEVTKANQERRDRESGVWAKLVAFSGQAYHAADVVEKRIANLLKQAKEVEENDGHRYLLRLGALLEEVCDIASELGAEMEEKIEARETGANSLD